MTEAIKVISPSRTYVAVCVKTNFDGNYFRRFVLPEELKHFGRPVVNNAAAAQHYFLNTLNFSACIEGCVSWEDFQADFFDQNDWGMNLDAQQYQVTPVPSVEEVFGLHSPWVANY